MFFTQEILTTIEKINSRPILNERDRIVLSFLIYNINPGHQNLILEAYDFFQKNPHMYDGTTGDEEAWVNIWEPRSLLHDYDYINYGGTFKGRLYCDLMFRDLSYKYRVNSKYGGLQFYILRWGGMYFQIKNKLKKQSKKVPEYKLNKIKRGYSKKDLIIEILGYVLIIPFLFCFSGAIINNFKKK